MPQGTVSVFLSLYLCFCLPGNLGSCPDNTCKQLMSVICATVTVATCRPSGVPYQRWVVHTWRLPGPRLAASHSCSEPYSCTHTHTHTRTHTHLIIYLCPHKRDNTRTQILQGAINSAQSANLGQISPTPFKVASSNVFAIIGGHQ